MTLLAGLAVGVFVYFLVGFATGYAPEIKIRRFRPRKQISNRQLWLNQANGRSTHNDTRRPGQIALSTCDMRSPTQPRRAPAY
jgi:hypothetical protein